MNRSPRRRRVKKTTAAATVPASASKEIDARIKSLPAWQGEAMSRIRRLIKEAVPDVVEEVKWRKASNAMAGVPVWSHEGMICTGETYKTHLKFTFAKGGALDDPAGVFTSGAGGTRRALDIREGDKVDAKAFKAIVRHAAELNAS